MIISSFIAFVDVKDEIEIKDEIAFTKFLIAVAARTGQLLNYANISKESVDNIDSNLGWKIKWTNCGQVPKGDRFE